MNVKFGSVSKKYNFKNVADRETFIGNLYMYYMTKFPLFINILMTLVDIEDVSENNKDSLAYTYYNYDNERIKIHINFSKIEENDFSKDEIMFIILHEYLHNYYYHFTRMKEEFEENHTLSNIITDYYINEMLFRILNTDFKSKGLDIVNQKIMKDLAEKQNKKFPFNYNDKPLENTMYKWFKDNLKMMMLSDGTGKFDDHETSRQKSKDSKDKYNSKREKEGKPSMSDTNLEEIQKNKINAIEEEIISSTGYSKEEADLVRHKEEIVKKNDFLNTLKLKRIINNKLQQNTIRSYKRMSRKRQSEDIIFKGKEKRYGNKVIVALDVSGSISDNDLKIFYEMLNGLLNKHKDDLTLDVIYWSSCKITEKNYHKNIKSVTDLMKFKIHSSGGTVLDYLHEFINTEYKNKPIILINITDGWFSKPELDIPKNVLQYYFVLTENNEKEIIDMFQNNKVNTAVIKETR